MVFALVRCISYCFHGFPSITPVVNMEETSSGRHRSTHQSPSRRSPRTLQLTPAPLCHDGPVRYWPSRNRCGPCLRQASIRRGPLDAPA